MSPPDQIIIANLELRVRIGVTLAEQAHRQRLTLSLVITPEHGFNRGGDQVENTINYSTVCKLVRLLAAEPPRQLIETFAQDVVALVLERFPCAAVEVELRKYVVPDTDYVAVRLTRERSTQP